MHLEIATFARSTLAVVACLGLFATLGCGDDAANPDTGSDAGGMTDDAATDDAGGPPDPPDDPDSGPPPEDASPPDADTPDSSVPPDAAPPEDASTDDGGPCNGAACPDPVCGDGTVDDDEDCDDEGNSTTCDDDCTSAECGDGFVNAAADEDCDTSGASASCDADCSAPMCGDGVTNQAFGEECDDGADGDPDDGCDDGCEWSCDTHADCSAPWRCNESHACGPPSWRLLTPIAADASGLPVNPIAASLDGQGNLVVAYNYELLAGGVQASFAYSADEQPLGGREAFDPASGDDTWLANLDSDMDGTVVAALLRDHATGGDALVATLSAGTADLPTVVGQTAQYVSQHAAVVLDDGTLFSAWTAPVPDLPNPDRVDLYGSVYTGTWSITNEIESSPDSFDEQALSFDGRAGGILSIAQGNDIYVALLGTGFSPLELVVSQDTGRGLDWPPCGDVAIDAAGNALIAWNEYTDTPFFDASSQLKVYDANLQTWGDAVVLEEVGYDGGPVRVALDAAGNGLVAWVQFGIDDARVRAARYDSALGLQTPVTVYETSDTSPYDVFVGVDDLDSGVVVWAESLDVGERLASVRYEAGAFGTEIATLDMADDIGEITEVSMQPDGRAAIAWMDGEQIQVARYE